MWSEWNDLDAVWYSFYVVNYIETVGVIYCYTAYDLHIAWAPSLSYLILSSLVMASSFSEKEQRRD